MADDWYDTIYENKHDAINDFIKQKQTTGRSPRTLNSYSRVLKRYYHEHFPDLTPEKTEVRHIEEYLRILDDRGVSQNTKRRYLESLSAFFSYAMKRPRFENITGNPAGVVLEEIPKQIRKRPDCATWENTKKIVRAIPNPRNKAVAVLLAKTGCRLQEALEIKMDDLMLDDGFIRLRKRKGGNQTVVPIDRETVRTIKRFKLIRRDTDLDYLFVSIRGDRLSKTVIQRAVDGEDRFHKKFTPHTFRTVFTTLMRNQEMKPHILQYIRGDANSDTMDIYTRVDCNDARTEYLECMKPLGL
jgi:integrase/recombinase XerD